MDNKKFVRLNARSRGADEKKMEPSEFGEFRTIEESNSKYYVVCTNMWSDPTEDGICMCTYSEPAIGCETYEEARSMVDKYHSEHKKCPYCEHTHFRVKDYESLKFDNENVNLYFHLD